ncbi:unnamed protein product [Chrysoparadoxa australica]
MWRAKEILIVLGLLGKQWQGIAQTYECGDLGALHAWLVDASQAYSWSPRFPQGCTCEKTGVSIQSCDIFDCACTCDTTAAGKCDYGCCCDTECSSEEVQRFEALESCAVLPSNTLKAGCYDRSELAEVNPTFPLSATEGAEAALEALLCVQYDNSDSKGSFYPDLGTLTAAVFSEEVGRKEYDFTSHAQITVPAGEAEGDAIYDKGDRIPAASSDGSGGLRSAFGGFMPLPTPNQYGRQVIWIKGVYVLFETAVIGSRCNRVITDLEADCESQLNGVRVSSALHVAVAANGEASINPDAGSFVPISISAVTWRDWESGREEDFPTADYLECESYYFDGTTTNANNCVIGGTGGNTIGASTITPSLYGCRSAVTAVCYTFIHNGAGSIVAANAELTVTDVPFGVGKFSFPHIAIVSLSNEYTVQFKATSEGAVPATSDSGNLVPRVRSGNPGYLWGLPVLAGEQGSVAEDALGYVTSLQRGMQVMASSDGTCDSLTSATVQFGDDMMSCCALTLTRDEMKDLCQGRGAYISSGNSFTPAALATSAPESYLGIYGNADPLDLGQWLKVDISSGTATNVWDEPTGTCSNMVTSLNWRILYTLVGSKVAPQNKIVAAEARYSKETLVWWGSRAAQTVPLCTTVTFVELVQDSAEQSPPAPPIGITVPW